MAVVRTIKDSILQLIDKYPVLALTGPRQSGKTTFLKTMLPQYRYVNLEDPDQRKFALNDPRGFLMKNDKYVIFDEVQRVPDLFSYIQAIVDESGIMGQFILSGSQNFHLMQHITQSLAGRVAIFKLFPFDFQELRSAGLLGDMYLGNLTKGFYPAIYDRNIPPKTFYSNYIQTYIQRDVSELVAIKDMALFKRFLSLCATRAGQLINLNSIATDCGISQPTAKSWLSTLESSYVLFLLPPYHENFSKRLIKTPKLYFYDTGLLCHLLKLHTPQQISTHPAKGMLFENMMIAEYLKRMYHRNDTDDLWFWRDAAGNEVDLLVQRTPTLEVYEFKATQTIMPNLFKGLATFEKRLTNTPLTKNLVYAGNEPHQRSAGNVLAWNGFGD